MSATAARAEAPAPARGRTDPAARPGSPAPVPADGPRVVHVPADHDYVRHATTRSADGPAPSAALRRASVPSAPVPSAPAPSTPVLADSSSAALPEEPFTWPDGAGWLARHGAAVDVLHVHFGVEQLDLAGLARVLDAAGAAGVAVVWTVHDLSNPHLADQGLHEAQVALLARRCAGLLTLTPGAADEVARRYGRRPVVVPHPHLAPPAVLARRREAPGAPAVVGLPLGMLRPAVDPAVVPALLAPAVRAVLRPRDGAPAVLRVSLREEVLDPAFPRTDPRLLRLLRHAHDDGRLELVVGPRTPDDLMWDGLASLDALVLPYRWGTHSGWVEACHDVGTPVVAPALGRWGEQHRLHAYDRGPGGPDTASLARALADALARGPRREPVLRQRLGEREASVTEHARLHALAAAGGRW